MSEELPFDWYEFTLEQWRRELQEKGFEDAEINFRGFASQGDGASFTCSVNRTPPQTLLDKLVDYEMAGPVAARLRGERYDVPAYELSIRITRYCHQYVHENTIQCDIELRLFDFPADLEAEFNAWADAAEQEILTEARELSRQIYRALEQEYDYLTAELAA